MSLTITCPINSVSFGLCSYNILKELYKKDLRPNLFPIGNPDISCFDKMDQGFKNWMQNSYSRAFNDYSKKDQEFKLWHLQGGETKHCDSQTLLTFFETNVPSELELNIVENQHKVLFTSSYTAEVFKSSGATNTAVIPLGFDNENFYRIDKRPYADGVTVWTLAGKFEPKRKHTDKVIQLWAKMFGNHPQHRLHIHCFNVHLHQDPAQCTQINQQVVNQVLGGQRFWNISLINKYFGTLTEYNQFLNSGDIFLDGSGNENWNLPGFHSTALGKYIVTVNSNGVKEWANEENAVLVTPGPMEECYDDMFFRRGTPFNNGHFFSFDEAAFAEGMKAALKKFQTKKINEAGLKLQQDFTWQKTTESILNNL